jgi:hypothetical protein
MPPPALRSGRGPSRTAPLLLAGPPAPRPSAPCFKPVRSPARGGPAAALRAARLQARRIHPSRPRSAAHIERRRSRQLKQQSAPPLHVLHFASGVRYAHLCSAHPPQAAPGAGRGLPLKGEPRFARLPLGYAFTPSPQSRHGSCCLPQRSFVAHRRSFRAGPVVGSAALRLKRSCPFCKRA